MFIHLFSHSAVRSFIYNQYSPALLLHMEQSALVSQHCHASTAALLQQLLCRAVQLHGDNLTTLPVTQA